MQVERNVPERIDFCRHVTARRAAHVRLQTACEYLVDDAVATVVVVSGRGRRHVNVAHVVQLDAAQVIFFNHNQSIISNTKVFEMKSKARIYQCNFCG